jgi:hypothetical protein
VVGPPRLVAEKATDHPGSAPHRQIASRLPRWALPQIQVLAVAALAVLAVGVRQPGHLFTHPFWLDESWVADSTRAPWGQLRLVTSSTPIGWTVLLRAVPRWGDAERYRLLPLAFAVACVVPAWCLGRQLMNPPQAGGAHEPQPEPGRNGQRLPRAGWLAPPLAGLAAALAPTAVGFPYLKQYTAEAFVSLLLVALLAWVERGWSLRRLAILAAVAAASFLVANTAPLITAAMFGGLVLAVLVRRAWSRLGWLMAAGVGVGVVDGVLYRAFVATGNGSAMERYWARWYIPSTDWQSAIDFAAPRTVVALERIELGPWPVALALILAGIIALWRAGMPAAALVVPIAFVEMIVAGLARQYPYFEGRTSMFMTVLVTVVAAIGLAAVAGLLLRWRWTAALSVAVLIGIGAVFLPAARQAARRPLLSENTRAQVELLRNLRRPGDVVVVGSLAAYQFAYYWPQQPTFKPAPPSTTIRFQITYPGDPTLVVVKERSLGSVREAMDRLPPGTRRVWILLLHEGYLPNWAGQVKRHGGRLLAVPADPCAAFSPVELARAGLPSGPCPLLARFNGPA